MAGRESEEHKRLKEVACAWLTKLGFIGVSMEHLVLLIHAGRCRYVDVVGYTITGIKVGIECGVPNKRALGDVMDHFDVLYHLPFGIDGEPGKMHVLGGCYQCRVAKPAECRKVGKKYTSLDMLLDSLS